MSEQWSDLGSGEPSETTANGTWAAGAVATDALEETPDAAPMESIVEPPDVGPEGSTASVESAVSEGDSGSGDTESSSESPESTFLSELARAMLATAASERLRMDTEIEQRRAAHVEEIRTRQTSEADRMRELAAEELTAIDAWAKGERDRIRHERDKRAAALDEDLATSLADHTKQIDAEIERVEDAVATYRSDVDAFFADLESETDVVVLARRATTRPAFPDLNLVVAPTSESAPAADPAPTMGADAAPTDGAAPIGVMDPAATGDATESWIAEPEPVATAERTPDEFAEEADIESTLIDDDAPQPVAAGVESGRKSLFQSVQVVHPTSWLRRNGNGDESASD